MTVVTVRLTAGQIAIAMILAEDSVETVFAATVSVDLRALQRVVRPAQALADAVRTESADRTFGLAFLADETRIADGQLAFANILATLFESARCAGAGFVGGRTVRVNQTGAVVFAV